MQVLQVVMDRCARKGGTLGDLFDRLVDEPVGTVAGGAKQARGQHEVGGIKLGKPAVDQRVDLGISVYGWGKVIHGKFKQRRPGESRRRTTKGSSNSYRNL